MTARTDISDFGRYSPAYATGRERFRETLAQSKIEKWLRNKNTIEFLGIWEEMYNSNFNSTEFGGIKNEAGTNRFLLSVKQWVERTNSRGIMAKAGRYGGTYAQKDIAFEFASWVSPKFKLYPIRDYQRLNEIAIHQMKILSSGTDGRNLLK